MKIILKEDITNLGNMGEIVTVKNGYARNYLFPRDLAVEASSRNIKELEHQKKVIHQKTTKVKNTLQALANRIASKTVFIKAKAGEEDKLFGSVTNIDIEGALRDMGFEVDKKKILIDEPIKRLGEYTVKVKLHPEVTAEFAVQVIKE